ncbi:hypothetical protein ACHAQE_005645 [Botrytis cinerea]
MRPQSQQSGAKISHRVPPPGYMYAIRTNELIEKHLQDLDAKDWSVLQRHEYEQEIRQRALQLIDQSVANYLEDIHLTRYMEYLNWYYEYGDSINIQGSVRVYNLPMTRGDRGGGIYNSGHSDLSISSPATIQSSIRYQASSSRGGGSTFANKQTLVHQPNADVRWELSPIVSSQYSKLSRTLERSIGDAKTKEDKIVVEIE